MPDLSQLSRREREIMEIVFAQNEVSTNAVVEAMKDPPSRTSVRTILRILEEKGYLKHRSVGREYVYRPVQSRRRAASGALKRVLNTFFDGSLSEAVAAQLSDPRGVDDEELNRLAELIDDARQKGE